VSTKTFRTQETLEAPTLNILMTVYVTVGRSLHGVQHTRCSIATPGTRTDLCSGAGRLQHITRHSLVTEVGLIRGMLHPTTHRVQFCVNTHVTLLYTQLFLIEIMAFPKAWRAEQCHFSFQANRRASPYMKQTITELRCRPVLSSERAPHINKLATFWS
jgi:hypothetical protein